MAVRNQILEALRNDLLSINNDNGFKTNVKQVLKKEVALEDQKEFPSIFPVSITTEIKELEGLKEYQWNVGLVLYYQVDRDPDGEGLASEFLEDFVDDVDDLFSERRTVEGGILVAEVKLVKCVESVEMIGFESDPINEQGKGLAYLILRITYHK